MFVLWHKAQPQNHLVLLSYFLILTLLFASRDYYI